MQGRVKYNTKKGRDILKKWFTGMIFAGLLAACFSGSALGAEETQAEARETNTAAAGAQAVDEQAADTQAADGQAAGAQAADTQAVREPAQDENGNPLAGDWSGDGEEWQFLLDSGEYLEKAWIYDRGKWYYMDEDGFMVIGSQRIGGKYYFFRENGEMAVGWAYDEDADKWYYMNDNGTRKTGWLQAGGVWYWFDSVGAMYNEGFRMVSGHKYYFFENGQMAGNQYVGTYYYGADGLRDRQYDIVIQGKRKPSEEEKDAITKAMENIPGEWMERCVKSGWEFMYYTDREYFSAPRTEQGIYYVYHQTDTNYKKIKFTKPESLIMAFGEYVAHATGNDRSDNRFMADFQQYLVGTSLVQPLPSYFDDDSAMWFGALLECYCNPDVFYDMKKQSPDLAEFVLNTLGKELKGRKPTLEELRDRLNEESDGTAGGMGPSTDATLKQSAGPASDGGN